MRISLKSLGFARLLAQNYQQPINFGLKVMSSYVTTPHGYVDVHAHLIHEQFKGEEDAIIRKAADAGLDYVVCNGLEPISNRATLALSEQYPHILPALGIYPLDAACNFIVPGDNWNHPFSPPEKFDIEAEIAFIDTMAAEKKIVAVGECGLDKHYLTDTVSFAEQERVLRLLMRVTTVVLKSDY